MAGRHSPAGPPTTPTRTSRSTTAGSSAPGCRGCGWPSRRPSRSIGVRALFIAHWVDNALAGAALEGGAVGDFIGAMQIEQTGMPFATGPCPDPSQGVEITPLPGRQCNTRGLSDLGEYAVERLMDNHMLIEADHLSEWARERVLA